MFRWRSQKMTWLLAGCILMALCFPRVGTPAARGPALIGVITTSIGPEAPVRFSVIAGANIAARHLMELDGIPTVIKAANVYGPQEAVRAFRELVAVYKVDGVVAVVSPGLASFLPAAAAQLRVPLLVPGGVVNLASLTDSERRFVFHLTPTPQGEGRALAWFAHEARRGGQSVWIVSADAWPHNIRARSFQGALRALDGTKVIRAYSVSRKEANFVKIIGEITALSQPTVLYIDLGQQQRDVLLAPFQNSPAGTAIDVVVPHGSESVLWGLPSRLVDDGSISVFATAPLVGGLGARFFTMEYLADTKVLPSLHAFVAYRGARILGHAVRRSGALGPEDIVASLRNSEFSVLGENIRFDRISQAPSEPIDVMKMFTLPQYPFFRSERMMIVPANILGTRD